jgi:hypothetical protein
MERFYHIRARQDGKVLNNGGATVHLRSIEGDPLHLEMRVSYCNPGHPNLVTGALEGGDVFCKKSGRDRCVGAPARVIDRTGVDGQGVEVTLPAIPAKAASIISLRDLPSELGKVHNNVHRSAHIKVQAWDRPDYDHRIREWLPKG